MNTLAATLSDRQPPEGLNLRTVLAAWRGITRQQVLVTFLLGCGMFLYRAAVTINIAVAPFILVADQMKAFALLLSIVVADRMTGKDPDRRGAYIVAAVIGAAVGVPASVLAVVSLVRFVAGMPLNPPGGIGWVLNIFFELLMVAGTTIWVINDRRRARRARVRRHVAELERIAAEKRSIESDLQAMQARIEPQFLFDTLAQVKLLYARSHAAGERLLDALIAYLRAAMPKMRETSTVRQELALASAYLSIVRLRTGERLAFSIDPVESGIAGARMPAMILLPLIDHAIAHAPGEHNATGSIRIRVAAAPGGIHLEIDGVGIDLVAEADGGSIAGVRARLAALYGRAATLAFERTEADDSVARLKIPYE